MSSHWSAIGIYSQNELSQVIRTALKSPSYTYNNDQTGKSYLLTDGLLELWVHADAKCAVPSFKSSTVIKTRATQWLDNENSCFYCETLCIEELNDREQTLYPLAVTFGNVALAKQSIQTGKLINLAVAVFIEKMEFWESIESYKEEYPDRKFGYGWFIPLGPFSVIERVRNNLPRALFYGIVQQIQQRTNPWTKHNYQHLLIENSGTIYEAVISDTILGNCSIGNLVSVEGWFCAKHID